MVTVRVTIDRDGLMMVVESIVLVTVPCGGVIVTITVDALETLSVKLRAGSTVSPILVLRFEVAATEAEGNV